MDITNETDCERQAVAANQPVKPLPPLPRGWSRVCHETSVFLRGIGLGIVVTSFQGFFTRNFSEPEKVAIRRSRITALLKTLIHAVPIGVAVFEIFLNLKGHFVGSKFDKQSYLQFAAKAHEIAMQASIATILLSYIRHQISIGKGMPFGAVLGGLQFLQVSYLWSVELWSSILSKDFQLRKKTCFAILILICITISATAGPSSASLLIARQGLWPSASGYLVINASVQDIWPDQIDDKNIKRDCGRIRAESFEAGPLCPISGLYSLFQADPNGTVEAPTFNVLEDLLVPTHGNSFRRNLLSSGCGMLSQDQFCATIPQAKLLEGLYSSEINHYESTSYFEGYQFLKKNYYQPYTVVSCVADVFQDGSDQAPLQFALISETESDLKKDREIVSVPGLIKSQIIKKLSRDDSSFQVGWVDLPTNVFKTGIPGAIIVNSQDTNGSSYNITTCTLNAGWGSSTMMTTTSLLEIDSRMSKVPSSWSNHTQVIDAFGYIFSTPPNFANISNFSYPERRISVSLDWIEFLNPTVVINNTTTEKFISRMLSLLPSQPTEANIARALNLLLAVALADTEPQYDWEVFRDLKNATSTCDTCPIFEVEYWILGWLYSASGTTTRLAVTVMIAYCALVFGHVIYSAISGISSTAWDSTAELVALAMNSSPTKILQNTCAGIAGRKALKTSVRVLATSTGHLELVFGEIEDPNAPISNLVMNQKYGKLKEEDDSEDDELDSHV